MTKYHLLTSPSISRYAYYIDLNNWKKKKKINKKHLIVSIEGKKTKTKKKKTITRGHIRYRKQLYRLSISLAAVEREERIPLELRQRWKGQLSYSLPFWFPLDAKKKRVTRWFCNRTNRASLDSFFYRGRETGLLEDTWLHYKFITWRILVETRWKYPPIDRIFIRKTRPFSFYFLPRLFIVYFLVACSKFLEDFVYIYIIYIYVYSRRTKVNRSVGASTEKRKRVDGFAQKTVLFMYRVSLKWFALGIYIILWWSVIVGQMDLFTLCLLPWNLFKPILADRCLLISLNFFLRQQSLWLSFVIRLNEVEWTVIRIVIDKMKRSWNFFDKRL